MKKRPALSCLLLLISYLSFSQAPSFITDSLDHYINRGMKQWEIPGLAIAVIKDGKTVVMKGYGVREIGRKDPVDEHTLFMIASNSKLFTATSIAKMEAEGKLSLENKVSRYIPWFRLYDSSASKLVTLRDILSHHLGTKTFQGDFTFWDSNLPKDSIIWKLRLLKPSQQFRKDFGYCNTGFLTAGQIISVVTGSTTWDQYVQDNILTPLGMSNTYPLCAGMEKRDNVAMPYSNAFSSLSKVPFDEIDNFAPAGSIVSCVKDVAKWLQMQLDTGKFEGRQVIPRSAVLRTRDINTIITSRKSSYFPTHVEGYGLGVFVSDYNGRMVYWHTGGAFGFVTNTCFVPEENLAITILTNNDNQNFFEALRYQILDAYLGVAYTNRSDFFFNFFKEGEKENAKTKKELDDKVNQNNAVPIPLSEYCGDYYNTVYGDMSIKQDGKNLKVFFSHHPSLTAELEYMNNNEFRATYSNIAYGILPAKFKVENNKVISVDIKVNDFVEYDAYRFNKKN